MNESYVELLVKRKASALVKVLHCIFVILYVLMFLLAFAGVLIMVLPALLLLGLDYWMTTKMNIEYEYLYVDKSLNIDMITNKSKRKLVAEYDLASVMEIMAPFDSHQLDSYRDRVAKTVDYSSKLKDEKPYGMVVHVGNELILLKLSMTEELYKHIYLVSPRKVFKD